MKAFDQNIRNTYGERTWLAELPSMIEALASYWHLKNIEPVKNMSYHYVAKALSSSNQPVVLKISCDSKAIAEEKEALAYFNGHGSIQMIDYSEKYNALLLQQAVPGITLTSFYPEKLEFVMDCYVEIMRKLHDKHLPNTHHHTHVRNWLRAIGNVSAKKLPLPLVDKAIQLKESLLETSKTQVFLHGDLHHDNILQYENGWVAIDPKGVVGEPEFEIAAFDFMYVRELATKNNVKEIVDARIDLLARKSNLDPKRIKAWIFVRLILMAAWAIEDNSDPDFAIKLAELIV